MTRRKLIPVRFSGNTSRRNSIASAVKSIFLNTECKPDHFIGKILIGTTLNYPPEKWLICKVSFLCVEDEVDRIHLEFDEISLVVTLIFETDILKEIFTANVFSFGFHLIGEDLFMDIHFKNLSLPKFNKKIGNALKTVFEITHKISTASDYVHIDENNEKKLYGIEEIDQLYASISSRRINSEVILCCENVQHPSLKPLLRPYQVDAVKWMMMREKHNIVEDYLHPLYSTVTLPSGKEVYFDKYSGYVTFDKPSVSCQSRGGILGEEMGLGKTVEILALILNNPFSLSENISFNNDGDDSDELSDNDIIDIPIFQNQSVKRAFKKKIKVTQNDQKKNDHQVKPIKVPENWVKKKKPISDYRTALMLNYEAALAAYDSKKKPKKPKPPPTINCICGETYKSGQVECTDCKKLQHKECLGYMKRFGPFKCPTCWLEQPLVESGSTLIVTPASLRNQWCNEIRMHVNKKLKVLVYEGSSKTPIYPTHLKYFDIVITTYNVLQTEFRLTERVEGCELRRKRKYDFQGSPLSRVKWWRLCLDEAQTVDSPGRIVSEMAKKLTSHFRWAVSGTPISKQIADIFGIISYLQIEPYNELETWTNILYNPYLAGKMEPLCSFLSEVMWRSTKNEVIEQIGIPKQTVKEHFLEFSAVEKFFYNKEHELCSEAFIATLRNIDMDVPLAELDKSFLKKIMVPLLSLRQVCNHPNVERGKYLATRKPVSTMKDLLDALILKNSNESEEHLRVVISCLNGLAGIYSLFQNPLQAVEEYRKVIQLSVRFSEDKSENNLVVDRLQLIHAMHNLADLLESYSGVPPTLHDDTLRADCLLLEQKYIEKFTKNTLATYLEYKTSEEKIEKILNQFTLEEGEWYSNGLEWIQMEELQDELAQRILHIHDISYIQCPIQVNSIQDILYFIAQWHEKTIDSRAELIEMFNSLFTYKHDDECKIMIDKKLVLKATECHLQFEEGESSKKTKNKCPLCVADSFLKKYESKLFQKTQRTKMFQDMSLPGSWQASSQEVIFRALCHVLKTKNAPAHLINDGTNYMNLLESIKGEFKELRQLWLNICHQVAAQDELDMCKIKLRLEDPNKQEKNPSTPKNSALKRLSSTIVNKLANLHVLNEHELDYQRMLLEGDELASMTKLEKNLGVRKYLETLRKQQYEGGSPDPCPICTNMLDKTWSILSCGHCYCMDCLHSLRKSIPQSFGNSSVTCSVCRQINDFNDVSYIKSAPAMNEDSNLHIRVRGNFSTKIEATIKLILELKEEDQNVKVLVFSSWTTVLKFLKDALLLNDIKSEVLLSTKLEERVERFKDEKERITALLLPVNLGGKGLNLIEATHVILLEPLLNPGEELQAIGRVHRIGQTKPTFVHKFCVKNTIEESILTATSRDTNNWHGNKVTLKQLKQLFEREEIDEAEEYNDNLSSGNDIAETSREHA